MSIERWESALGDGVRLTDASADGNVRDKVRVVKMRKGTIDDASTDICRVSRVGEEAARGWSARL